jgi:cobalamin biosynthesis Mg chelatase CobN
LEQISEAAQAEEENEHSDECLNIFIQETKKTTTWEFSEEEEEAIDNIILDDLYKQIEALETRVIVQGMHIQ